MSFTGAGIEVPGITSWTLLVRGGGVLRATSSPDATYCTLKTAISFVVHLELSFACSAREIVAILPCYLPYRLLRIPLTNLVGRGPLHLLSVSWLAIILQ
jgi:hypothetical protein